MDLFIFDDHVAQLHVALGELDAVFIGRVGFDAKAEYLRFLVFFSIKFFFFLNFICCFIYFEILYVNGAHRSFSNMSILWNVSNFFSKTHDFHNNAANLQEMRESVSFDELRPAESCFCTLVHQFP